MGTIWANSESENQPGEQSLQRKTREKITPLPHESSRQLKTYLFACVHNAGRSQMAAALFNLYADMPTESDA